VVEGADDGAGDVTAAGTKKAAKQATKEAAAEAAKEAAAEPVQPKEPPKPVEIKSFEEVMAEKKAKREVGASRYCSPRHPAHFETSLLGLSGIL
jgi:hypothetical protein